MPRARRVPYSSTARLVARRHSKRACCRGYWRYSWTATGVKERVVADTLLLIDDDAAVLKAVGDYLEKSGWEVQREGTAENGLESFNRVRPAVVILDLHLPDANGLDLLEQLRAKGASVILLTGQGDIETAVRAMQLGAENFITKPADMVHLAAAVARVGEKVRLARQNALLRAGGRGDAHDDTLESLGVSPGMKALAHQVGL